MRKLKKILGFLVAIIALVLFVTPTFAEGPIKSNGLTPYGDVYVAWDGVPGSLGDWWVDTDLNGTVDYGAHDTLDMVYDFEFKGKTLQFDETYVEAAIAHPQTHHVVLTDNDGDGTYEGALTARYDAPWSTLCPVRMDVIEYTVDTSEGVVGDFNYVEHEYCLPTE